MLFVVVVGVGGGEVGLLTDGFWQWQVQQARPCNCSQAVEVCEAYARDAGHAASPHICCLHQGMSKAMSQCTQHARTHVQRLSPPPRNTHAHLPPFPNAPRTCPPVSSQVVTWLSR
jgi:hypothetical protein